ncbi:hypothetical protein MPSEU_000553600 [Mayamaea pseudoterrestris]|nr:hypothetical protein MPSEU_000553600 [Mayamaea pseudoterrestris]
MASNTPTDDDAFEEVHDIETHALFFHQPPRLRRHLAKLEEARRLQPITVRTPMEIAEEAVFFRNLAPGELMTENPFLAASRNSAAQSTRDESILSPCHIESSDEHTRQSGEAQDNDATAVGGAPAASDNDLVGSADSLEMNRPNDSSQQTVAASPSIDDK